MQCRFQIVPVAGKGLGAVATVAIAQGEWVLRDDPPLLRLGATEMARFDHRWPCELRRSEEYIRAREKHFEAPLQAQLRELSVPQQQAVLALHSRQGSEGLAGIFFTNALPTEQEEDWVLCETASRFNSSCQQNAVYQWSERQSSASIRAVWDIPVGEEISVFYGSTEQLLSPGVQRREFLSFWGFDCCCPACSARGSDDNRRRIRELSARLDGTEIVQLPMVERYSLAVTRLQLYQAEKLFFAGYFRALAACVQLSQAADAPLAERRLWAEMALRHAQLFHAEDAALLDHCAAAVEASRDS
ncbi:set5 [Symbiodinium natans]|uniref:Set5 protein n=1 Tax=Symbiodinium natans TaxID=878477 RepID=A0A812PAM5_9DINO|nr:set5 [Symbiodinium natans]